MTDSKFSDIPPYSQGQGKSLTPRADKLQEQQEFSLDKRGQRGGELFPRLFRLLRKDRFSWPMRYQEFCALAVGSMAPLYNTARRITGDPHEAEDLVQDTYQRALQAYHHLKSPPHRQTQSRLTAPTRRGSSAAPADQKTVPSFSRRWRATTRWRAEACGCRGLDVRARRASIRRGRPGEERRSLPREATSGLIRTRLMPAFTMPSFWAARWERSMARPRTTGPRSVIRTRTDFPFARLITSTGIPNGSVGCAAVRACWLKISPLAVRLP
jgi:hypothetical protein